MKKKAVKKQTKTKTKTKTKQAKPQEETGTFKFTFTGEEVGFLINAMNTIGLMGLNLIEEANEHEDQNTIDITISALARLSIIKAKLSASAPPLN